MKLSNEYFNMSSIIFQQEIDEDDANKLISIFKNWVKDEVNKRQTKKGKLLTFSVCAKDEHYSIYFGNKKKYMHISNGHSITGDILKTLEINKIYLYMINEIVNFIKVYTNEHNLKLEITPSEGLAEWYTISK